MMATPVIWPLLVAAGVLGLAVGSFLNVVTYRVPREQSIAFPASHCPHCSAAVRARHNVPVLGWLALRGRCADCRSPISPRYPLVEAGTGLLVATVTAIVGLSAMLPLYLLATLSVLTLALLAVEMLPGPTKLPAPHRRST